jgi:hypothetical protein
LHFAFKYHSCNWVERREIVFAHVTIEDEIHAVTNHVGQRKPEENIQELSVTLRRENPLS